MRFRSNKRKQPSALALLIFFFMVFIPAMLSAQISIFRPKIGVPAFPLTNGTFDVEIESALGLTSNGWSALLVNDLRSWTCSVERVDYGSYVHCNSTTGYLLTVRAPGDIAPEVFQLVVSHSSAGSATNRHSVKILQNYETNFYILHYADPQVETENATAANGAGGSHGSVQAIYWASCAYSLINPRFMFNTGDEVENGVAGFYPKYLDAIDTLGAPLLITRGNNDAQGSMDDWKRDIGQPTYSITMGSFYVCMKDYGANENLAWFTNNYAGSFTNTGITFRLFGQHYNSGGFIYTPPAGQYPDLMLVGHNHIFSTLSTDPYYVLSSGPGWDYGAVAIFEFSKSGGGWVCSNKTIHGTSNKLQVYGDWGQPCHVTNTFLYGNNGSVFTNITYITNGLNYDFWDGQVRFLMRKAASGYTVNGGEKIAEYDYTSTNTAVLVKVNICKNAMTTVTVSPVGTNSKPQTITFPAIADQAVTNTVGLSATASSGLPVSFSVGRGPAQIADGTNLSFTDKGFVSIIASQAGDSVWNAAPSVTNSFAVNPVATILADPAVVDSAGNWYIWFSGSGYQRGGPWNLGVSGPGFARGSSFRSIRASAEASTPVAGDFDGDRYADPAVVDSAGNWNIWFSGSGYQRGGPWNLGVSGPGFAEASTPVAGDFDGDRYTDPAMVDNAGAWFVWFTSAGYRMGGPYYLGVSGTPVAADFDGDWYADPAVIDNAGAWFVWFTSMGYQMGGPWSLGVSGPGFARGSAEASAPLAADFDGDWYADPAMVDNTGAWFVWFTSAGYRMGGPYYLGVSGTPLAADFDGR